MNETLTKEEKALVNLYYVALLNLKEEHRKYIHNWNRWIKWTDVQRLNWVYRMEHEAKQELPFAVELVSTALSLKLKS